VLGAPLVALVRPGGAVLDELAAVAATTANPQLRVELLERAWTEPAEASEWRVTEGRTDEAIDK
jgi:hypothetical protein